MTENARYATSAGTARYAGRFGHLAPDHFRQRYGLTLSSIGLGTYLGSPDAPTGEGYIATIRRAVEMGCNVIDTAVNYRYMQSERNIGEALAILFDEGKARRDEIVICTKGGFVPFEDAPPADPIESIYERFYETGITEPMQLVGNVHCMAPDYLSNQIGVSLANLGLETIDVYYLHNPETQLDYVTPAEFRRRIRAAFTRLEAEAAAGRIRFYGIATWDGLRAAQTARNYLPLSLFMQIAHEVGGEKHRFRFIQFPYNLRMLDALLDGNQIFEGERNGQSEQLTLPLLAAARQYALVAMGSAGLSQRQLFGQVPSDVKEILGEFVTDAQYAIQFNRSTPGLTSTLIGMGNPQHVEENLRVAERAGLTPDAFFALFR
jgi:aryl-alcohol dehydrogenase-like predicted oxidoreductase